MARTWTMPKSGSRNVIGFGVPQRRSVTGRVLMKYTSERKGLLKPYFQPCKVDMIGRFWVFTILFNTFHIISFNILPIISVTT